MVLLSVLIRSANLVVSKLTLTVTLEVGDGDRRAYCNALRFALAR